MIMENLKELRATAKNMEPMLRIGKNGINENIIEELKKHLKKRRLVKIKLLGSFLEGKEKSYKKEIASELAQKTGSLVIDQVGFVVVLWK